MDTTCYTFLYIPLHHYPWCSGLRPRPCHISCRQNIYFYLIRRLIRQKYHNSYGIKSPSHSSCPSSWWSNDPSLTRVNEFSDSINKGIIEHDTSSNIADSHNSHEQPENQPVIHASRYSNFYKSHDGGNKITRNLEQLIIPQPSVPDRTTQERGYSTERSASVANSHQNHVLI